MTTGPQHLLNAVPETLGEKTGTVCYYNFADDEGILGGCTKWRGACFADLSCIKSKIVGTPAFMSLRIGVPEEKRECDDAYVRWLFDPKLSPWRAYADELMPTQPMLLTWKGVEVNIHSHEFRRDVGVVLTKHVSRRVGINFLKAYRLLGEYTKFIEVWHEFVQEGFDPTDAFWCAQFCYPMGKSYKVPYYYGHSVFNFGTRLLELLNLRDGRLQRDLYEHDASMMFKRKDNEISNFGGCDQIWQEKHPDERVIKFNGDLRVAFLKRVKANPVGGLISGGLRSRGYEERYGFEGATQTAPKEKVFQVFKDFLQEVMP